MVAQVVSMVVASTVVTLNAVNIHVGNLVAVSTVGNLRAVNVLAGSLVAANIPVGSMVAASTVNVEGMASIATERTALYVGKKLSGSHAGEPVGRLRALVSASNRTLTRPMPRALAMARRLSRRADPCQYSKWRLRTDLRLGPADVMLQLLDHELPVADDALDQISDRDDAETLTIIDHRQMAHALGAHDRHAFLDRFVGLNAYHVALHDFADQRLWRCATLQKHVAGVVPLGNDPDELASVEHHQRADVLVGHHLDRVVHCVARMDRPYLVTLLIEDVTNCCHDGTGAERRGQADFC